MNCEEHLILRLPEDWNRNLNSDWKLEFVPTEIEGEEPGRFFKVRFGPIETYSVLLDLPCIIESHKTLDYINFFKNSDLAQMMYVIPEHEKNNYRAKSNLYTESSLAKMLEKGENYKLKSGITPGTHNITSRFFKREMKEDLDEIKKVESLIKSVMDCGTARLVEEEIIELAEGQSVPQDYEETYDPNIEEEEEYNN
jgi:transcription initiation factor TFIID subunit 7